METEKSSTRSRSVWKTGFGKDCEAAQGRLLNER
jgi:hypothetical protein